MADHGEPPDVESFAASVGLDERATQGLSDLPPQSQFIIMSLVKKQECRNPSAVTWSKVKAIQHQPLQVKAEYLRQELDDPSYAALSSLPLHLQELVISQVDVLRSRNLSAVVWTKMRAVGVSPGAGGLQAADRCRAGAFGEVGGGALDEKIEAMGLDEAAQEALARLNRAEQREVLSGVNPEACRNPSAVVIKRIQEIRKHGMGASLGGRPGPAEALLAAPARAAMSSGLASLAAGIVGAFSRAGARDRSRTPTVGLQGGLNSQMAIQALRSAAMSEGAHSSGAAATAAVSIGGMALRNSLDERAQRALSLLQPQEAQIVMGLVAQEHCKNPSAVCWTKVKKVKENFMQAKMEYILKATDENAAAAFSELPEDAQEMIVSDVDVTKCRNLSAVIWSKVKDYGSNGGAFLGQRVAPGGLQLDSRAREALESLPEEDQTRVMEEVESQSHINNPSAFVWSKVKQIRQNM